MKDNFLHLKNSGNLGVKHSQGSVQRIYMKSSLMSSKKQLNEKVTLNQLEKQGFLICEKVAFEGRGLVALFKPHK